MYEMFKKQLIKNYLANKFLLKEYVGILFIRHSLSTGQLIFHCNIITDISRVN